MGYYLPPVTYQIKCQGNKGFKLSFYIAKYKFTICKGMRYLAFPKRSPSRTTWGLFTPEFLIKHTGKIR